MILDKINPDDLFPNEEIKTSVLGTIVYKIHGESNFDGAYIATNQRLILNADMNGEFYYRSIAYNEIENINMNGKDIDITFNIGNIPIKDIKNGDAKKFVDYIKSQI